MDLHSGNNGTPGFQAPINLGNPVEFTIRQLAEMVIRLTGSTSKMVFRPLPLDDPLQRKPDITLAKKYLNDWAQAVKLEEGLNETIRYFEEFT